MADARIDLDSRAFDAALKVLMARMISEAVDIPERMAEDMAARARGSVRRRTGATAATIEARKTGKGEAELVATNPYLEFGTSRMRAQPFYRPAQNIVAEAFRAGQYKPEL